MNQKKIIKTWMKNWKSITIPEHQQVKIEMDMKV